MRKNTYKIALVILSTAILTSCNAGIKSTSERRNVEVEKYRFDQNSSTFMQVDRAFGETATDYPMRACGAEKAKELFNDGTINKNDYERIINNLAKSSGGSFQFLDFRTLTRGTVPYELSDQCRRAYMSNHIAVGVTDDSNLPSIVYHKADCSTIYYKNIGGGRFDAKILLNIKKPTFRACSFQGSIFVDVNKDGYVDLVTPYLIDKSIYTVLNDGKGNFDSAPIISNDVENLNGFLFSMTLGDLENRGVDDIIIANRFQAPGNDEKNISSPIRILRNTGKSPYWREDTLRSIPELENNWTGKSYASQGSVPNGIWYASYQVMVGDFDYDGKNDILEIGDGWAIHMLWNKGEKTYDDKTYEAGLMLATAGMGITPVNLEGGDRMQLFVSDAGSDFSQQCEDGRSCPAWHGNRLFTTNGSRKFGEEAGKYGLGNTGWAFGAIFSDISSNGYPELVVGTGDTASGRADETFQSSFDKPYLMRADKNGIFQDNSYNLLRALKSSVYLNKVYVGDFDGDRKPDLMLWGYDSSAPVLLLNRGGGMFSSLLIKGGEGGSSTLQCSNCKVKIKVEGHKPYTLWNLSSQQNYGVSSANVPLLIGFGSGSYADIEVTFSDKKISKYRIYPEKDYEITE